MVGIDPRPAAALDYATAGWPVFPCHTATDGGCSCGSRECESPGKHPRTANGCKDATTDTSTIRAWWDNNPDANIGIATGPPGPTVIDCDGPVGKRTWSKFVAGIGWDTTPWACTGGGGWHVYYAGDPEVRNRAAWLPKVDVRGLGGYVVAPPSTHSSGADYWWVAAPDERALAPLPAVVHDALKARSRDFATFRSPLSNTQRAGNGYAQAALDGEVAKVRSATVGTRNDVLVRASFSLGQLVGTRELERDTVIAALFDAGRTAGLGETETLRTIASGIRGGCEKPRRR